MEALSEKIQKIEFYLLQGEFRQGYKAYYTLCCSYEDFKNEAEFIFTRYNVLRRKKIELSISLADEHTEEMKIHASCKDSIGKFKECYLDEPQPACYTDYEKLLQENRDHVRETKAKYEDECINCDNPQKTSLLEQMVSEFKKILKRLEKLLQQFAKIREYERI